MALPPYALTLGLTVDGELDGAPILVMPFGAGVTGRPGFVHGGALGGLLEMAAIAALRARFGDGDQPRLKPVNVTVQYMRGGRELPTLAVGIITRQGNRVANLEAIAWQEDRTRPIASAWMNVLIARD
jgi:acyl-coenzyme A thioesterase PaaI-like protein